MFTRKDLMKLILPLVVEQLLAVSVGMIDIILVSRAGENAISGVSLVDTINILLINVFSAMATGGAVVVSQYIGKKKRQEACEAANQLLLSIGLFAFAITAVSVIGNRSILSLVFGDIDPDIMQNARVYFYITALSFPFLAVYNGCAALFRSMGNSTVSMKASFTMNIVNAMGGVIFIYGFHFGVEGVALPCLAGRAVAAIIMVSLLRNPKYLVNIRSHFTFRPDVPMIKRILQIGVPNGLENGMFHVGKILVLRMITSFGNVSITANSVASTVAAFAFLPGVATALALITVVGRCVGAKDYNQAKHYTKQIMKLTYALMFVINILIIVLVPNILGWYHLSSQTAALSSKLLIYHSICCIFIWPASFTLPSALRAASDVRFTMLTSIFSMWVWRIAFSYVLGEFFHLGVFGVWVAMTIDWLFRGICFEIRFLRGRWKLKSV